MKVSKLNQFNHTDNVSAGFTLIELLVSMSIMGIVFALVGTGITFMVTSDQKLAAAQSRRVEVSHALDLISYDIRKAENVNGRQNYTESGGVRTPAPAATVTAAITASGEPALAPPLDLSVYTPVLFLKISIVCNDNTIVNERVIYSTKAKTTSPNDGRVGPNILYRYGRLTNEEDKIPCSKDSTGTVVVADPVNVPIADNITPLTPITPTPLTPACESPAASTSAPFTPVAFAPTAPTDPARRISKGFYTCVSDNQVSISLFAALSNSSLIYGDNRTITSGAVTNTATVVGGSATTSTAADINCTVPDLLTTPKTPSEANTAIKTNSSLSYAGIPTTGGTNVVSQTPSAGSKIPCNKGLVTYTY